MYCLTPCAFRSLNHCSPSKQEKGIGWALSCLIKGSFISITATAVAPADAAGDIYERACMCLCVCVRGG